MPKGSTPRTAEEIFNDEALALLDDLQTKLMSSFVDKVGIVDSLTKILTLECCQDKARACLVNAITFQTAMFGKSNQEENWYSTWKEIIEAFDDLKYPGDLIGPAVISLKDVQNAIARGEKIRKEFEKQKPNIMKTFILQRVFN
ncbi:hypothetical protein C4546_01705 [Candidatus Parcubacteria bacterium]|jgi:hypothetical protein|nr:MAG: hypothetical protein C4546_01705 [Candidatus Parcubacteria bacterium]